MKTITKFNLKLCTYLKNQNEDKKAGLRTFVFA